MRRTIILLGLVFSLLILILFPLTQNLYAGAIAPTAPNPPAGPDRYATCDFCGFCVRSQTPADWATITPPGAWESCRKCLYPSANPDPKSGDTLKITDSDNSLPATPATGRHYTSIGCFSTDLAGGFTNSGAAGSVVQTLFNFLFGISSALAFLYLIYGAFLVATSRADPERLNQGRRTVIGAVVGIIFIASAIFLVNLIGSGVLKIPGFGN